MLIRLESDLPPFQTLLSAESYNIYGTYSVDCLLNKFQNKLRAFLSDWNYRTVKKENGWTVS